MQKKNIFIVGLDDFNLKKLERLPEARECNFYPALDIEDIRNVEQYDLGHLIDKSIQTIESRNCSVDGVATYYDFPGTTLVPILAEHFKIPGPTLEGIMKCENKYWSRLEQQSAIPEHIPQFRVFDPFDDEAYGKLELMPPFWVKPVKSFRSFLSYRVNDEQHFKEIIQEIRNKIGFMGKPFRYLMERYHMPDEIVQTADMCIAESPLSGSQCTLEGYVFDGQVVVYGVVDSVREQDRSSFSRYEYPTSLPLEIQHRMIVVVRNTLQQIGLDNTAFNAEFFFDQTSDQVYLLEINPRVSQAHTDIFEKVHGVSHLQVMLSLALGRKPKVMEKHGKFNIAGHFMLRVFEPGTVLSVPGHEEVEQLTKRYPGTHIKIPVKPGQHLGDLQGQDSYSYEIANILVGGRDQAEILDKYHECVNALTFEIKYDEAELKVPISIYRRLMKFKETHGIESVEETLNRLLDQNGY